MSMLYFLLSIFVTSKRFINVEYSDFEFFYKILMFDLFLIDGGILFEINLMLTPLYYIIIYYTNNDEENLLYKEKRIKLVLNVIFITYIIMHIIGLRFERDFHFFG